MEMPKPEPTDLSRPYWDALREGYLVFQRCRCGNAWLPARTHCPACLKPEPRWERASGRGRRNRRGLRSGRRRSHRRLGQNGCCRSGGCRCDRRSWRRRRLDASRRRHGRSRCCTGSGWGRGFRHGLGRKVDHRGFARIRGKRLTVPARGEDDAYGFLLRFVSHRTLFWGSRIKLTCR